MLSKVIDEISSEKKIDHTMFMYQKELNTV